MLKQLLAALAFAPVLAFASAASPVSFQEGVHYEVVAEKATAQPEVLEFFPFIAHIAKLLSLLLKT